MKIKIFTLFLFVFITTLAFAQTPYSIKGSVRDSSSNINLTNTTICVLNAKDSTLVQFTLAATNGSFNIGKLSKGKFILLVSFPEYADYVDHFTLDSVKTQHDFGKISLTLKSKLLKEVMIKGSVAAIKIKGDTTIFDPRAYTIQPNSKVEDLLKQLPGIQVDKDGKITAQGQTVSKVLVDGEEFFGDDPTLVTKNIRGDMVDKVQLYDKKSDQAAFTGIDDGQKTKTINIQLKEDKKNGYFGKLDGGAGTDKYFSGQALYNRFQGKKKFSVYGIASNTGKTGLGWDDNNKLGTSSAGTQFGDDGSIYFTISGSGSDLDSYDGRYRGEGFPTARTSGVHYDAKWDADKKNMNTNYKAGYLSVNGFSNTITQNTGQGSSINSNANDTYNKSVFRQKFDYMYQVKLDTATTLKFSIDGTLKNSKNNDSYLSASTNLNNKLLNRNNRTLTNNVDGQLLNASALFTKKLKKMGRTISVNVSANINNSDAKGFLNSAVNYYNATTGAVDSVSRIDQYKTTNTKNTTVASNATYTEPLSKKLSLIFNYGLSNNNSNANRQSFNPTSPGNYTTLDKGFSNDYTFNQLSNQFGATLNYRTAKSTFNVGSKANAVNYKQTDELTGIALQRNFLNWNPSASYQYRFTQQKSVRISYNGYTRQPTIDQIQPVRVNTDPLNISLGNPALRPEFDNSFNFSYNSYKILSDASIYIYGYYSFTSNAIISSSTRNDTTGVSTYQSINLTNKTPYNYYLDGDIGRKLKFIGVNISVGPSANGSKSYNYVTTIIKGIRNTNLNTTTSNTYSARLRLSKYKQKKYDFSISGGPGYTVSGTSLQPDINNNGYTFSGNSYLNIYFPGKIQLSADGNYDYRGKTQSFDQTFSKLIVNSSLNKTFLKGDNLKMAVSVNDLLNQNQGFDRNAFNGTIYQNSYATIKRYFMFTITYDFNQMGGTAPKK